MAMPKVSEMPVLCIREEQSVNGDILIATYNGKESFRIVMESDDITFVNAIVLTNERNVIAVENDE